MVTMQCFVPFQSPADRGYILYCYKPCNSMLHTYRPCGYCWLAETLHDILRLLPHTHTHTHTLHTHTHTHTNTDYANVLLVGSGDLRHVLTTLANASHHTSRPLHVSKLRNIA